MKKVRIIKFALIFLIIVTMASCQSPSKDAPSENNDVQNINDTYDINNIFYNYVEKNPIDLYYKTEMDAGVKNISEIVNTYTSSWIEEFDNTLSNCDAILSDAKSKEIISLLSEWKNTELSIWNWQKEEIFENSISTYGTQMYYDEWKTVGDEFREKTIWLKHQMYIVETSVNPEIPINELDSVKFSVLQSNGSVS